MGKWSQTGLAPVTASKTERSSHAYESHSKGGLEESRSLPANADSATLLTWFRIDGRFDGFGLRVAFRSFKALWGLPFRSLGVCWGCGHRFWTFGFRTLEFEPSLAFLVSLWANRLGRRSPLCFGLRKPTSHTRVKSANQSVARCSLSHRHNTGKFR